MEIVSDPGESWKKLVRILESEGSRDSAWRDQFARLVPQESNLHSRILRLLTHLDYKEDAAKRHWEAIQEHQEKLARKLGRNPGLRVAILDYFANLEAQLRNPKVIEIETFLATEINALTDHLTGLFNRYYFDASLRRETKRAQRYGLTFSLVLLDVDDFKEINDRHGHQIGDRVLADCSKIIRRSVREIDVPCRYGGEEFALILPETSRSGAYIVSDRIRADVKSLFSRRPLGDAIELSVSGGIAIFPTDSSSEDGLVHMADQALYRSKHAGKDRITLHADEKRRSPRFDAQTALTFEDRTVEGPTELTSQTKNLSRDGVLVESRTRLDVGTVLAIRIAHLERDYTVKGRVVRLEEVKQGNAKRYDVGIAFVVESDEQVRLLEGLTRDFQEPFR